MIKRYCFIVVCAVCLTVSNIALQIISMNKLPCFRTKPKIHACVRTKNNAKHMEEFLKYHIYQGITSFNIYDDSDDEQSDLFGKYPSVTYKYVGEMTITNENYFIWECMVEAIVNGSYDYILNMDDDEFIFPVTGSSKTMSEILESNDSWFYNNWCIANPVLFFGTIKSSDTGYITVDFIHRDRDMNPRHSRNNDPAFMRYVASNSNKKVKKRIEKAIFKIPHDKARFLTLLGNGIRYGSLIHGYTMNCMKQHELKVAHYTRSNKDLKSRINTFWKNVHGLTKRFNNDKKVKNYLTERNRTEMSDSTLREISTVVFK